MSICSFTTDISELCRILQLNQPPNGLELSGPAKIRSDYRAELAGSAPASG